MTGIRSDWKWRRLNAKQVEDLDRSAVDPETLERAGKIVDQVREGGAAALRRLAQHFGDLEGDAPLFMSREQLFEAMEAVDTADLALLKRTAERIETFARAQKEALGVVSIEVAGGRAGHQIAPVQRAGCYAPGGRYPLPSSVLMTVVTARAAGVEEVWVASPRPAPITLAAAAVAGADGLLAAGGAQAIAAMAYGAGALPAVDVVVGPGNRWVTAAKQVVAGWVGIDMPAGPSELVVLADADADPEVVAADLLAQAEHDPEALPVLVTTSARLVDAVEHELLVQLADLPTAGTAKSALDGGYAVLCDDLEEAVSVCDRLAPEHLEVLTANAETVASRLSHWGGLFIGPGSAEVFGDYGAGPNHTLPTGRVARYSGGLSVFDFLRVRTWLRIDRPEAAASLVNDSIALARLEGLEAHARSAERRRSGPENGTKTRD